MTLYVRSVAALDAALGMFGQAPAAGGGPPEVPGSPLVPAGPQNPAQLADRARLAEFGNRLGGSDQDLQAFRDRIVADTEANRRYLGQIRQALAQLHGHHNNNPAAGSAQLAGLSRHLGDAHRVLSGHRAQTAGWSKLLTNHHHHPYHRHGHHGHQRHGGGSHWAEAISRTPALAGLTPEQTYNAKCIIAAAQQRGLPPHAAVIALATSLQESGLRELANPAVAASEQFFHSGQGHDHDSVGLFQQRNSWGNAAERMNPTASAHLFYDRLTQIPFMNLPVTVAAQRVQRSAFPAAYARHVHTAQDILNQLTHSP